MKNYYEILEVNPKASKEVIKKAYQVLVKKYHPDLYAEEERIEAEQKVKDINEAYKILSDEFLKEQYDAELEKEMKYSMNFKEQKERSRQREPEEIDSVDKVRVDKVRENKFEQESNERTHKVGTFMSLVDLTKSVFRNVPRNNVRSIKKEDLIAVGLTVLIVLVLGVILWFIPATNGFIRSMIPFI